MPRQPIAALPAGSAQGVIGIYAGGEIYETLSYLGMRYAFDRIAPASYRLTVSEGELFVEPGLLYVLQERALDR